jgi:cation diffusion facilitator CzcD-associated flavoprotein CzcO
MSDNDEMVIIVGAGLAGISASYYLSRNNIPHILLEKSGQVGGIWSSLKWPGIRCDTEIINYSYSFRPYTSDHYLVSGENISEYLHATANELGITAKVVFNTEVSKAEFSEAEKLWRLHTNRGVFKSRFLINTNGYFTDKPYIPEFEGFDTFKGDALHLFDVGGNTPIKDRHVVLVGSGASAISAAPALTAAAASMTMLQRSPSYIYEQDNDIGIFVDIAQKLHRAGFSAALNLVNILLQLKSDLVFVLFRKVPWLGKLFFRYHWRGTVDDKTYNEHFRPVYNPWEQRIPVAIGLKEIIENKKIHLVTGHIKRFTETGILLDDGRLIKSDLCILATGFKLRFFKFEISINGQTVDTRKINFYKGMMMGGIPNYFQPFGPPHTSFTRRVETISKHIVKIILHMREHGLDMVKIERKQVRQKPRITPNYIMRDLSELPAIYGTMEIPTIDNLLFFRFKVNDYIFSGSDVTVPEKQVATGSVSGVS